MIVYYAYTSLSVSVKISNILMVSGSVQCLNGMQCMTVAVCSWLAFSGTGSLFYYKHTLGKLVGYQQWEVVAW